MVDGELAADNKDVPVDVKEDEGATKALVHTIIEPFPVFDGVVDDDGLPKFGAMPDSDLSDIDMTVETQTLEAGEGAIEDPSAGDDQL